MAILVKGKTIATTIDQFKLRLQELMLRENFPKEMIERELKYSDEIVSGKRIANQYLVI